MAAPFSPENCQNPELAWEVLAMHGESYAAVIWSLKTIEDATPTNLAQLLDLLKLGWTEKEKMEAQSVAFMIARQDAQRLDQHRTDGDY